MKDWIKNRIKNMKLRNKIFLGLLFLFVIWLVAIQFQTYTYPDAEEIDKRLNYLERVVYQPLDPDGEIYQIGYESHEFMLFSYAYSAYALTNIAVKDSTYKERAIPLIRECIAKSLTRKIYSAYGVDESLAQQDSVASFSVLYLGASEPYDGVLQAVVGR